MISQRQLFLQYLAQTSDKPLLLEIEKAKGIYLYSPEGKGYMDLISGVSVSNVGHSHPRVIKAIKKQLKKYMHLMVYGEYVQSPQVEFAKLLVDQLPENLNSVYLVNSGSEAVDGALKLAKRYTGRSEIIAFKKAYHGSTHGALSVMGDELFKNAFRPLLPGIKHLTFNDKGGLDQITERTACVIVEPIQGEAGIVLPTAGFLPALRKRCTETGTLLIFDEIQTGFGRTGNLFAFQTYQVIPNVITIAKAMGGGMPLGGFVSSKEIMFTLTNNPVLGHITTFGGHPLSCAAAKASLEIILNGNIIREVENKGLIFKKYLQHPLIKEVRGMGLFLAVELQNPMQVQQFIASVIEQGLVTDWFLFADNAFRIAPPLTITEKEIRKACHIILSSLTVISEK